MANRLSNAKLCVSPLTGTVFIAEVSKRDPNVMNDTQVVVPESMFFDAVYSFVEAKSKDHFFEITVGGKVILRMETFPDNLKEGREIKANSKKQPL